MVITTPNRPWTVYIHTTPIGKYYVGITSQKPELRWGCNGNGYKDHGIFGRAIAKYGWDNIEHEIVASNLTCEEAANFERLLIERLHSNDAHYGYNLTSGGDGFGGTVMSRKSVERAALANSFAVCQFDLDMNLLKEYKSASEAARVNGIHQSWLSDCCNGNHNQLTAHGYVWMYKKDINESNIDSRRKAIPKRSAYNAIPICQFDNSMNFICEYQSLGEAEHATGFDEAHIAIAMRKYNDGYMSHGYFWIPKSDIHNINPDAIVAAHNNKHKRVYQYSFSGELINTYSTLSEAGRSVNASRHHIYNAIKSKSHIACGYVWLYQDQQFIKPNDSAINAYSRRYHSYVR